MKRVKILLTLFVAMMVAASCTTTQRSTSEDFDESMMRRVGDRVYVNDPYYGTVILERDPVSGRYYDVTNGIRGYGYYGYPYNRLNNRVYRGNNHSYGNYNRGTYQRPTQPTDGGTRTEARKRVLGN